MRALTATLLATLLALHGAVAAAHPVACAMSGAVTSGRCCCDADGGVPALTASCLTTLEAPAVANAASHAPSVAAPVAVVTVLAAAPSSPARLAPPSPPDAGPGPPIPILHGALLI